MENGKISLLFSGGVESVLLYYLIVHNHFCSYEKFNLYLLHKHNNPVNLVVNLYNHLKELWNDTISTLNVINFNSSIREHKKIGNTLAVLNNEYDIIYYGLNKYPPNIKPNHSVNTFTEDSISNLYKIYNKVNLPFIDFTKDKVIELYYKNNIQHILPITISCGSDKERLCKLCFNCRERIWAYKKLELKLEMGI